MKYKVGDKVKVRKDLKCGGDYKIWVNDEMVQYAGQLVEITNNQYGSYNLKGISYCWTDDMFEDEAEIVDFKPILEEGLSEVQKSLNNFKELLDKNVIAIQTPKETTFTWEAFKGREICVNCKGSQNIIAFLKECDEQSISFEEGDYKDKSLVEWYRDIIKCQYNDEICFLFRNDYVGGLAHDLKEFFIEEGFEVFEYQQTPKSLEDYSDAELVKELLRRHTK